MLTYPQIAPEIFTLGPFAVRWYGLMYVLAFVCAWLLGKQRTRHHAWMTLPRFEEVLTIGIMGVIFGGRFGYVLFYDAGYYASHPLQAFAIWHGGMSFHGGLLGVLLAMWYCARKYKKHFFDIVDFVAPLVPSGLFFGRIGNFLNAELWGRVTNAPIGMVFPGGGPLPRHPSQLYEAALEGAVLFVLLWWFSARPRPRRAVSGVFALGYGSFRFFVEFFREPDAHLGFIAFSWLSMGMLLSVPLIGYGLFLLWQAYSKKEFA